ncbi:aconitase iron-sulfur domain-containing protein [Wolfiporia cocos MD-104 SS10]|uniref:Aconitase iron-sulfur domain-containing protein n=1 Tax=Wolfiporia cocos (strain MD-104) TaxID=742152 RepID=A0A2H3JBZ0_WOLCO|nr:aconitase iron-sulfur domain-containing protein [Wolfiporia cocos MD-104 SS10]
MSPVSFYFSFHHRGRIDIHDRAGKLTVRVRAPALAGEEFPGADAERLLGRPATVANMSAEVGATMSTFPYTPDMRAYLTATGRAPNLSELEPTINAPFTPDLATPLSNFGALLIKEQGWKDELSAGLIGSCTNSSYKDMTSVADLAKQAKAAGLTVKDRVELEDRGDVYWKREDKKNEENAILTSFNHNFKPRNDGNTLRTPSGVPSKFTPPKGQGLPAAGFAPGETALCPRPTSSPQPDTEVVIRPDSQRLDRLEPFPSHFGEGSGLELPPLKVLMRIWGKWITSRRRTSGSSTRAISRISRRTFGPLGHAELNSVYIASDSDYCDERRGRRG